VAAATHLQLQSTSEQNNQQHTKSENHIKMAFAPSWGRKFGARPPPFCRWLLAAAACGSDSRATYFTHFIFTAARIYLAIRASRQTNIQIRAESRNCTRPYEYIQSIHICTAEKIVLQIAINWEQLGRNKTALRICKIQYIIH